MKDIHECAACGITGELADLHHEAIDGILICKECNGDGELCLQAELEEFNKNVKESMKPKNYFGKDLKDQEEF